MIKHRVKLTADERDEFERLVRRGAAGWKLRRAQALLKCDEGHFGPGRTDEQVAQAFDVTTRCPDMTESCGQACKTL
mgnify:CR=1 FL=1